MNKIVILLFIIMALISGCKNPLDESGLGKSVVDPDFSLFLEPPAQFAFTNHHMLSGEVTLEWAQSARASSYEVKYGTSSGSYSTTASCLSSPCRITGLVNGTTYYFIVVATNAKGSTSVSSELEITPSNVPTRPTSLIATAHNASVGLTWGASTGEAPITYSVLRSTTSGSGFVNVATALSSTSYTDSTVVNGTTYYYIVSAENPNGPSGNSTEVSAMPVAAPGSPSALTVTSGASSVALSWSASSGLGTITYNILRSTTSGSGYTALVNGQSGLTYTDSTAIAGTTYYYVVNATNAGGTSSNSSQVSAMPLASFTLSSVTANGNGSLQLTWGASAGSSSYSIKYGTSTGSYSTTLTNQTSPATISGLTSGTTYYFSIAANNISGAVDSNEVTGIPLGTFTATPTTSSNGQVSLAWGASSGASTYTVKYGTSAGVYTTTLNSQTSPTIISSLAAGTAYYFQVTANNANGSLSASEVSATPLGSFTLSAATVANSQSVLSWGASLGASSYTIKYGTTAGSYPSTFSTNATSPTTVTGLTNGTVYYFMVSAVNATGSLNATSELSSTPIAAPLAPTGLAATVGVANAQLSWSASSGMGTITYSVLRSTTAGSGYSSIATGLTGTSYSDLTALNGTTYYYVVNATNAGGTSFNSSEVSATPIGNFAISGVAVNGGSALQVTWGASSGASSYSIKYGTTSGTYTTTLTNQTSPTTIGSLTAGSTYYFMVVANNANGSVDANAQSSGVPLASFTMSSITPATGAMAVAWNASAGTTTYDILYDTSSQTVSGSYATTVTGQTSGSSISSLTTGVTRYFRVRANNGSGSLLSTNELSGKVYEDYNLDIPFDAATESSYAFSDSTKTDFNAGVVRLTSADQVDDDNSTNGFGGGTYGATTWNSNGYVQLNTTANTSDLDSSWTPQWNNIVWYWKMNGSGAYPTTGTVNVDVGGTTCTTGAGATYTAGKVNTALSSSTAYITCDAANVSNINDNITFGGWMKQSTAGTAASYTTLFAAMNSGVAGFKIQRNNAANSLSLRIDTSAQINSAVYFTPNLDGADGNWHHIMFTLSSGIAKVYFDGRMVRSTTYAHGTGFASNVATIGLGTLSTSSETTRDDWAVWKSVLTDEEVATIYNRQSAKISGVVKSRVMDAWSNLEWKTIAAKTTLPFNKELSASSGSETSATYSSLVGSTGTVGDNNFMTGLVGYWKFNETSGSSFVDSSGNNNNGVGYGGLAGTSCGTLTSESAGCMNSEGKFGAGINPYGSTTSYSYVEIPNSATLQDVQEDNSTYSVWYKPRALPVNADTTTYKDSNHALICKAGSHSRLMYQPNKKFNFGITAAGPIYPSVQSADNFETGQWYHVVGVFNRTGQTLTLYVNGKQQAQTAFPSSYTVYEYGTIPWRIGTCLAGSNSYTWPANGFIDEAAIWSRALDAKEVLQLYRRGGNRLKYQVRSCDNNDCSDQEALTSTGRGWKGPTNNQLSYFSEFHNNATINSSAFPTGSVKKTGLDLSFSTFSGSGLSVATKRYFQYRAFLESDDEFNLCNYGSGAVACSPELQSVSIGPTHYSVANPTVTSNASIGSLYQVLDANGFIETLGTGSCTGARYTISGNGSTFYYHNGSAWVASNGDYSQASSALAIQTNFSSLVALMGTGTVQVKAFLHSDGVTACEVSNIRIKVKRY